MAISAARANRRRRKLAGEVSVTNKRLLLLLLFNYGWNYQITSSEKYFVVIIIIIIMYRSIVKFTNAGDTIAHFLVKPIVRPIIIIVILYYIVWRAAVDRTPSFWFSNGFAFAVVLYVLWSYHHDYKLPPDNITVDEHNYQRP